MQIKKLYEIAEITSGLGYRVENLTTADLGFPFFTITDIMAGYMLANPGKFIAPPEEVEHYQLRKNDILISKVGANIKFGFMRSDPPRASYFSSNVIRVRLLDDTIISSPQLLKYLSTTAIDEILSLQKGSAQPYITNGDLGELDIVLDEPDSTDAGPFAHIALSIEKQIGRLKALGRTDDPEPILREISEIVRIHDADQDVLTNYPYPIAYRYGQYLDSVHDNYQRLTRLRDVFESITYFLYSVCLANYLVNLNRSQPQLDSNQRKAYNGYSIAYRLGFVKALIEAFPDSLFLTQLRNISIQSLHTAQEEFRNRISHTATFAERQVEQLHSQYYSLLRGILKDLEFLKDYNLVRIRSWTYLNQEKLALTETYRGHKPKITNETLTNEITEDRNHLLLINTATDESVYMNMYPFYQIVSNAETKNQEFMAFLKQRRGSEAKLIGECIPWSFELDLEGFGYLETQLATES